MVDKRKRSVRLVHEILRLSFADIILKAGYVFVKMYLLTSESYGKYHTYSGSTQHSIQLVHYLLPSKVVNQLGSNTGIGKMGSTHRLV
jgi:hypothetical protein